MRCDDIFGDTIDMQTGSTGAYYYDDYNFAVYASPFFNCQNFTIAGFNNAINKLSNLSSSDLISVLKGMGFGRKLLMIDVHTQYVPEVRNLFHDYEFLIDTPYTSTNGSEMHIFYIKLKH